jgi:hypothetical protein
MAKIRIVFNPPDEDELVLDEPDGWEQKGGVEIIVMPTDADGNLKVSRIPLTSIRLLEYSGKEGEFDDDSDVGKDIKCRIKRPKPSDEGRVIDDLLNLGQH